MMPAHTSRRLLTLCAALGVTLALATGCAGRRLPAPVDVRDISVPPASAEVRSDIDRQAPLASRPVRPAAEAIPLDSPQATLGSGADTVVPTGFHRVAPGESLGLIARKYGLTARDLATWNALSDPNRIEVGQLLRLSAPGIAYAENPPTEVTRPVVPPVSAVTPEPSRTVLGSGELRWPASGEVLGKFGVNALKGITIAGNEGDPVVAATDGTVIYSGVGPKGYGNLVVIRRDDGLLTSYAHNKTLRVKKDQSVRAGDLVADLGQTDAKRPMLYFEVRRKSKPIDPLELLPSR